jgi:hypothetical protein
MSPDHIMSVMNWTCEVTRYESMTHTFKHTFRLLLSLNDLIERIFARLFMLGTHLNRGCGAILLQLLTLVDDDLEFLEPSLQTKGTQTYHTIC